MTADNIRETAFRILHYACDHCDTELNYKGKLSEAAKFLNIENLDDLNRALAYLRTSKMLSVAEVRERDDELVISGIYYNVINWIADFKK